jgi:hypothetical protein
MPDPGQPRLVATLRLAGRLTVTREAIRRLQTISTTERARRPMNAPVASGDIDAMRSAAQDEHAWLQVLDPEDMLDLATSLDRVVDPTVKLPVSGGPDHASVYAILFGTEDTPSAWLQAGEAFGAVWLTAIERGISVLPLSAPVEVETTRLTLRRLLAQRGEPFLVLRFSHTDADQGH